MILLGAFDELVDLQNSLAETGVDLPPYHDSLWCPAPSRKLCVQCRHRASSSSWTVTRSIPVVTVSSWTTPPLLQRKTLCRLRQVTVAWFLTTNNLLPSSEQQLVNCYTVDSGCNGELMDNAPASAKKNAIWTGTGHSYIATKGTCMASSHTAEITHGSVAEYKVAFTDSAHVLMSTVAQQSVPIAVATDQRSFQSCSSGVLTASRDLRFDVCSEVDMPTSDYTKCSTKRGFCWRCSGGLLLPDRCALGWDDNILAQWADTDNKHAVLLTYPPDASDFRWERSNEGPWGDTSPLRGQV